MATAADKLAWINERINEGRTVYVQTNTRTTAVSPKTAHRWASKGLVLFKVSGDSLYMASGSKFVCADYCTLRAI